MMDCQTAEGWPHHLFGKARGCTQRTVLLSKSPSSDNALGATVTWEHCFSWQPAAVTPSLDITIQAPTGLRQTLGSHGAERSL